MNRFGERAADLLYGAFVAREYAADASSEGYREVESAHMQVTGTLLMGQ